MKYFINHNKQNTKKYIIYNNDYIYNINGYNYNNTN